MPAQLTPATRNVLAASAAAIACLVSPAPAQSPPATFTRTINTASQSVSVDFAYHPIRSANFAVLVQQADGSYIPFVPDEARTYHGVVTGYPGATAIGLLRADNTLLARISFEDGITWTTTGGVASSGGSSFVPAWPTSVVASGGAGSTVYAAEVGIDSTFNHFIACGGTPAAVLEQCEFSVMSANLAYLRDTAILHRIGKVIVRADSAQDPYAADGGDTSLLLPHIRTLWNTGTPMGGTHDLACVLHSAAGGGLAYVSTIGTSSRYSANDSDGSGDFSGVWRHEAGHNWGSSHFEGGGNPEGSTIMSNNSLARFSSSEAKKIIAHRNTKTAVLDNLGNYAFSVPPRANQDTASFLRNTAVRIDVLANDADSNGEALTLLSFDTESDLGGTLTRSAGTGTDGRDEILYTPPATLGAGTDWFKYRIQDAAGMQAVGYGMLRPRSELIQPADHWTLNDNAGTAAVNRIRTAQNGTHENGVLVNQSGANAVTRTGAYFDGDNDQTSIPAPAYNTNTLTFTAWIKRSGTQNASATMIFTRAGSSVTGFHLGTANELRYTWDGGGYTWNSGLVPPDNTWCLAAMCVSPTGTTLHLRTPTGLQSATNSATQAAEAFNGLMYLGWDPISASRHFRGWLDDVRAYPATLTAADLESLYQQAVIPPAVALITPTAGAVVSPLNVNFAASVSSFTELTDRVDFVENETLLATAAIPPYQARVAAITPGARTVTARATFGDWGYEMDSAPVTFTATTAPLPVARVAASLPASKRGAIPGSFTVTRDHPLGTITVPFTLGGSAVAGTDYIAIPTSVTLPDGSLSQTITVTPLVATPDTTSESLTLTLTAGAGYTLGSPAAATLTIDDHITSIATGAWNIGTTWNSGNPAPTTGTQGSGDGYGVAHTVTSNDTASNSQALVGQSLRVKSGGILDLARLHAYTNQNVSYNLPATAVEDGGTIRFRCSTGSSTHTIATSLSVAGVTTLRLNAGSYDNGANLTGTLSGSGTIGVISDSSAGGGTFIRKISVNKANNPFTGNWTVSHTGGGDELGALRAGAANALGSGTVTVGLRAQLINDAASGLNSLSGVVLNGTTSSLLLNQPWNKPTASLALTGGTPVVQLGNAASVIGDLAGTTGIIQGSGSSSSLTVTQATERIYAGELGANLIFIKSGSAPLTLAGALNPGLKLTLAQGGLAFGSQPVTIASLNQTGGNLLINLPAPGTTPLTLTGNLTRSAGAIEVMLPATPPTGVPHVLIAYQGSRSGLPPVVFSAPANATIDYGTGTNSAISVTFHNEVYLTIAEAPVEGGVTTGEGPYYQGTAAPITATPAADWRFVNWTGPGIADPNNPSTTVAIDTAKTVTANFARIQHALTVTASPTDGGTVTGTGTFDQGSTTAITASANEGWQFDRWTGTGIADPDSANTTVAIDREQAVTAGFVRARRALVWRGGDATAPTRCDAGLTSNFTFNGATDTFRDLDDLRFDDSAEEFAPELAGILSPGSLVFDHSAHSYALGGPGSLAGATTLVKAGAGKLVLTAACNHTGDTTVSGGTLQVDAPGSLAVGSAVHVAAAGTLGGNGSVSGPVSLAGTLAPGSPAGILSAGTVTFEPGSTLVWEINSWSGATPGIDWDFLSAEGLGFATTFSNKLTVRIAGIASGFSETDKAFAIASGVIGGFNPAAIAIDATAFPGTGKWEIRQAGRVIELTYTAPPDPFEIWIARFYPGETDPATVAPTADPDHDGMENATEFAFGFNPDDPNSRLKLAIAEVDAATVRLRVNRVITGGRFVLRWSDSLNDNWPHQTELTIRADASDFELTLPATAPRRFYQLQYLP